MIERTHDMALVKRLFIHPKVWPHISDDGCDADSFEPVDHDAVIYLKLMDGDAVGGVLMMVPQNSVTYDLHTVILPEHRGAFTRKAGQAMLAWMFSHTNARKINTKVPEPNKPALRAALDVGFEIEGVDRKSFLKDGVLHDQVMLGVCK